MSLHAVLSHTSLPLPTGRLTPLIRAVLAQSISTSEAILALGADIDQVTNKGTTALMVAGQLDNEVRCLL